MAAVSEVSVVLVHGGFVDGSGWESVYKILKKDGYNVAIVQNPTTSLADDVAVTKRTIGAQNGRVVLVGHSYGGVVITEAGNDRKVAGLVYIAAFCPGQGRVGSHAYQGSTARRTRTDDRMIPPAAQRLMSKRAGSTVVEAAGSHAIYVSQPNAVAALIEQAAKSVQATPS